MAQLTTITMDGAPDYVLNFDSVTGEAGQFVMSERVCIWGYYNDGEDYDIHDLDGNRYQKVGNTLTVTSALNDLSVSNTLTAAKPIGTLSVSNGGQAVSSVFVRVGGLDELIDEGYWCRKGFYNDPSGAGDFISQYGAGVGAFQCLSIAQMRGGLYDYKQYYDVPSPLHLTDCFASMAGPGVDVSLENSYNKENYDPETDEDPYNNPNAPGDFDDGATDDVDIPSLPDLEATDSGFITLFRPSTAQMKTLANYMWSDPFDLDTFKKLFANPMDCILGLSIVPVDPGAGATTTVKVGNISTGVSMTKAAHQYVEVDCGSISVKRESPGSYLDQSPYTEIEIYLPFIGVRPLDTDDVMGKTVRVVYHVDVLSGACTAYVKCGSSVIYQYVGSCALSVPISGNDWTSAINGVLGIAGAIGSMVATGGATAPMSATMIASTVTNQMKPSVEKSGGMSGSGGIMAVKYPYLIISRPRRVVPSNQNKYLGYPAFTTKKLSAVSGYNVIEDIHLAKMDATQQECDEIERLLKSGVIL